MTLAESRISFTQLMELSFVSVLSPAIRILPTLMAKEAKGAVVISAFLGSGASIIYIVWLYKLLRKGGGGLSDVLKKYTGAFNGKVICECIFLWLIFYTGFVLRGAGERLVSSVFDRGKLWAVMIPILVLSAATAGEKLSVLAGSGACVFTLLAITVGVISVLSVRDVKIEYITPVSNESITGILTGAGALFDVMTVFFYTSVLRGTAANDEKESKTAYFAITTAIAVMLISVLTVGALSWEVASKTDHPFFVMIRNITVNGVIERIDSVVIAMWVLTDFVYLTALQKAGECLHKNIEGRKTGRCYKIIMPIIVYTVSLLCGHDQYMYRELSEKSVPTINTAGVILISLLLALSEKLYVKRNKGKI